MNLLQKILNDNDTLLVIKGSHVESRYDLGEKTYLYVVPFRDRNILESPQHKATRKIVQYCPLTLMLLEANFAIMK